MGNFYVAYLLRLWLSKEAGKPVWRASLECPKTGDMLYFASLTRLFHFLESAGKISEGDAPSGAQVDCDERPSKEG